MDPIHPWLDPIEVRHLADQLMRPQREPAYTAAVDDAGFDSAFVGFASDSPAPISTPRIVPNPFIAVGTPPPTPPPLEEPKEIQAPELAPEPVIIAAPSPPPLIEPVATSARGPFLERILQFRDWMRLTHAATGLFILDRDGAVIFDESHHGRLHFLARSLALASRRPGASAGNVHVKIAAGSTLEVIPVETAYGCLVLGAVVPHALDSVAVATVMESLAQVAIPPEPTPTSP